LMIELELITPGRYKNEMPKMLHNDSHKFESGFVSVYIPENKSVMLQSLSRSKLGIWVAHGEGKFHLPGRECDYNIVMRYVYGMYPGNPNGSDYNVAAICSWDGRHLAMMPHLERSTYPWNWPYYPSNRKDDEISPWIEAFVNAREWIKKINKQIIKIKSYEKT
jgi:phosphoribosylformylglycinamidine synthase